CCHLHLLIPLCISFSLQLSRYHLHLHSFPTRRSSDLPNFELQQINKNNELESIRLSDLEGKGVMLNFWATCCKPCEKEMPYMEEDRKSTRLNSSHVSISYAVFCLKKKKNKNTKHETRQ